MEVRCSISGLGITASQIPLLHGEKGRVHCQLQYQAVLIPEIGQKEGFDSPSSWTYFRIGEGCSEVLEDYYTFEIDWGGLPRGPSYGYSLTIQDLGAK